MRVNVLVGGPIEMVPTKLINERRNEKWVGVDRGAVTLLKMGIVPMIAVGDFDSITSNELQGLENALHQVKVYPPEKNYTDTQLGIRFATQDKNPDEIDIFGATGGRLDHLLANIFLPLQAEFRPYLTRIKIIDCQNIMAYYLPGRYTISHIKGKKYLAFVNLTPVEGLTLQDEKYPLIDWNSKIPFSWTSNEFTAEENHFSFKKGIMAVIQCNDPLKLGN
ncbi:thiamine diphosphokinase [Limosilactobacillus sp. STM2_1]|uniref:Thiamine diphosphokinase n=1 Tax=Limosilactobacillus rudii TaxID=2759755 RepID=A0A7W3UJC5_9LACO|nr:thiamine diphosphokinase [Limosilactobacillus rudii]MBB1080173.1 thiamine diphosphokinase [Limosilactobacillus rudii]MBB1096688.1 thiamine diphosphokinase [Limosilactobacillus rudii]MCD7133661.1 thiamine diphosphokinase [Limosilactobacillus rudii]